METSVIRRLYHNLVRYPAFVVKDECSLWWNSRALKRWIRRQRMQYRSVSWTTDLLGRQDFDRLRLNPFCRIDRHCSFWLDPSPEAQPEIQIGERTYIGSNCYLGSSSPLTIGDDTLIGAYTYITTAHHEYRNTEVPIRSQGLYGDPVHIGSGAWIGTHVVIMPGVTIGDGAIVGAGAVVTHDVPPNEIRVGVPAKKIGQR